MTGRHLDVYLDGRLSGRLTQSASGNVTFEYDEAYRASDDATPLSLSMPLTAAVHRKRAVLPYLQGLLPDSEEALGAIARRYSVSANNPFALLEHVGIDAAGAIQLVPPGETASDAVLERKRVRRVDDDEVATMLSRVVSEYAEGAPYYDAGGRFSLAGAQPKIALHKLSDGSWSVPEDATPTTHILKPVAGTFRRIDVVEQMTMHAARLLGNRVASSELMRIGEWDVLVSERYDRASVNGQWRRLHQEDLCQALSVPPSKKYQHLDGGPGVADIAGLVRSLPLTADRRSTGTAFYRALVFNVIAGCTDAHAKNYSLMLEQRSVRLAPLYDLLSYAAYWDGSARLDSAMSVGGEYRLRSISAAKLEQAGAMFGVDRAEAAEIVDTTRKGLYPAFESARAAVERVRGTSALAVADELLFGLRRLPLAVA
ncbi:type II toxin-antitoxin system HipA family toxin [Jiangella alkaliphila]|uniref:Serine/threonine-protein kinase HipA n=1 Tax=Jiangella alkaliphila TaxID=419479 RepID=A0A1H2LWY3_9ACTN|nr:type II toxin-antitoxin system HipA family toxin [Jiangella alkaliphila]SDU85372.1 serine/threonine-protein kinase HipA [Jiangella alkaliphila]